MIEKTISHYKILEKLEEDGREGVKNELGQVCISSVRITLRKF